MPALTPEQEAALQALVDQAQELDMGYEGVSTLPSTPLPGSARQGGEQDVFFTAVYRVPKKHSAEFASEVCASAFWSAASWSHALDERDAARAALQQPVQAVPEQFTGPLNAIECLGGGEYRLTVALKGVKLPTALLTMCAPATIFAAAPGEPGQ